MDDADVTHCGVDIAAADFQTLAAGFGIPNSRVANARALHHTLLNGPPLQLIEVDASPWLATEQVSDFFTNQLPNT